MNISLFVDYYLQQKFISKIGNWAYSFNHWEIKYRLFIILIDQ